MRAQANSAMPATLSSSGTVMAVAMVRVARIRADEVESGIVVLS